MTLAAAPAKAHRAPCLTTLDYVPIGDGTFKAVPRRPIEVASLSVAAKTTGLSRDVLYRLYRTGFIKGIQPTPGKIMIDLASLFEHIEASKEGDFWSKARKKQFVGSGDRW